MNNPSRSTGVSRRLSPVWFASLTVTVLLVTGSIASAQIQTAGTLFVNLDATTATAGTFNDITNTGTLGGVFEVTNTTGTLPALIAATNNLGGGPSVNGIVFTGTNFFKLLTAPGAGPVAIPAGIVGSNATCSIEVWAFNPSVAQDESMVAWGIRASGQNMAFEYGSGGLGPDGSGTTMGGAQHFGNTTYDIPWDPLVGSPLNNHWHLLVYTYDGVNENLYSDGALVNSQAVSFNTVGGPAILLGVQWTATNTISTSPGPATLAIARVRIHDGALTPAQILNNYNFEKATFIPATPASQFLTAAPTHRYSFNEPATNDASGLTFHDSIGGMDGTVQGNEQFEVAQFTGHRLYLPGGLQASNSIANYGAPYASLPAGMVSANSTNNGGSGELSIEVWYKNTQGLTWSSTRVFDIGSIGIAGGNGAAVTGPGNYPSGAASLDFFRYTAQVSAAVNQRRLEWQNRDPLPAGSTTNAPDIASDVFTVGTYQTDRHVVITWKESTGQIIAYENGIYVDTITASNAMSAINDANVWFGRSLNLGDSGFGGEFDEIRFYTNVLTAAQVLGDFQTGADTLNTGLQAAAITVPPQSTTNYQGFPVSFYVIASGSPAVSFQWNRNGSAISGATNSTYTIAAVSIANNGDSYTCTVSNNTGSANTLTSTAATLAVLPNVAAPIQLFHETGEANPSLAIGSSRDNYGGVLGSSFKTGNVAPTVTHLGYYDAYGDGLNRDHLVGILNSTGNTIIASVDVPAGTAGYLQDGYRYVALAAPIQLAPNTVYILQGEAFSGDNDFWPNNFLPTQWNPYFVGTNGPATRQSAYGGTWPAGAINANGQNRTHGTPSMAVLPIGAPLVGVVSTNLTNYAGQTVMITALPNGQAPVSLQWYKGGLIIPNATNATLTLANVTIAAADTYYAIVNNTSLGSSQSANVVLTILADTPVAITQQPVSVTVPLGYPASFSISASGTTPIAYQWSRNSAAIVGATNPVYSIAAVATTNNGDIYSCVVSNFANGAPHTVTSTNATLTVQPNVAPLFQALHETHDGNRNDYTGDVGCSFTVGSSDALVTYLGYYCTNAGGLNNSHNVGIFTADGSVLLTSVLVPAGTSALFTNGYAYVALNPPFVLTNGTAYLLGAQVMSGDGDGWPDLFADTNWNPYFVGTTASSTRVGQYGGGWPLPPSNAQSGANTAYGAPNLAVIPIGAPTVQIDGPTSVFQYAGFNITIPAFAIGQAPLTVQWFKEPGTLLSGQTNTSLTLTNLNTGNSGNYYLVASNSAGTAQTPDVTLTVQALTAPSITTPPQSQAVYALQPVTFSVTAAGTPPLGYQWSFNGTPIPGATGSSFTIASVTTTNAGAYSVSVTNAIAPPATASATLTILAPAAGSYASAALSANPLVYFRFSDVTLGTVSTNLGSLGAAANGAYEGGYGGAAGPQPPAFPNFETTNEAITLNGVDSDVKIPALNINASSPVAVTLAAWINIPSAQLNYAGIIFHRGSDGAAGFGLLPDPNSGGEMLEYHWNNLYYDFVSSLDVPMNQWALVALVVQPTQAILYVDVGAGLLSATNTATHNAEAFSDTTYVGFDSSDGPAAQTRRFYGSIDEPMILNRALAPNELTALYQASQSPPASPIQISRSGNNLTLTWTSGSLYQSGTANGTYTAVSGAMSPYPVTPTATQKFYLVK